MPGIHRHFDDELQKLKERLLEMGSHAEHNVRRAIDMLTLRDAGVVDAIYRAEREIDDLHIEIDDRVIDLIARRQPVGSDLRFVLMASRIAGEVERIGDQAVNIAQSAERLLQHEPLGPNAVAAVMAERAIAMLRHALEAFVRRDTALARQVLQDDQVLDALRDQTFRETLTYMMEDSRTISRGLSQILISRNLERIGDQATNIAEEVIFMVEGREVRHGRAHLDGRAAARGAEERAVGDRAAPEGPAEPGRA